MNLSRRQNPASQYIARTALATAVSLATVSAAASVPERSKIRLQLDDLISSEPVETGNFTADGRLLIAGLIQSSPSPLFIALEERYESLPPFTEASEEVPEEYIAEATLQQKLADDVRNVTSTASKFIPHITSSVRYDSHRDNSPSAESTRGNDGDYQTILAIVNPTLRYQKENRKWHLTATYDYERGEYFEDRDSSIDDHTLDVNWTRRLERGDEIVVTSVAEDTHDRLSSDPILDFNSSREGEEIDYQRYFVNVDYRHGTIEDRGRYNIYYFKELSELNDTFRLSSSYDLDRDGVGANFTWQYRPRMALVAETRYTDFDYRIQDRDSDHHRALLGTNLILGRRMHAKILAGYEHQEFDQNIGNQSHGEFVWRANIDWAMRRKTTLRLATGKQLHEFSRFDVTSEGSRFNVKKWINATWAEQWTEKLSTRLSYTYRKDDWVDANFNDRAYQVVATAIYRMSNKLSVAFEAAYTDETSTFGTNFDRRTFTIRTQYSL